MLRIVLAFVFSCIISLNSHAFEVKGTQVIPHVPAKEVKFRQPYPFQGGARVEVFLYNPGSNPLSLSDLKIDKKPLNHFVDQGEWAWQDSPNLWESADQLLPSGALTTIRWNQLSELKSKRHTLSVREVENSFHLSKPKVTIEAATFLGPENSIYPNQLYLHLKNAAEQDIKVQSLKLWIPKSNKTPHFLFPSSVPKSLQFFPKEGSIPRGDSGCIIARFESLPLTYCAIEVAIKHKGELVHLWSHLRIKKESFDIGGGWVHSNDIEGGTLRSEKFLKTLKSIHVNAGMHGHVSGYTDSKGPQSLYEKYPVKMTTRCLPLDQYDRDEFLPRIHAVEFLGEPQYRAKTKGAMPPKVLEAFRPYRKSRIATSVTLSDANNWHLWAGLSDYPHYDAYRVCAPRADSWHLYKRWGKVQLRWGSPLETIGDMTRSLRENSKPASIAYWAQGPFKRWGGYRKRNTPTQDELRLQAYHGLAARITSLYWFNLSLSSMMKYPDTLAEIQRIGRETKLLQNYYLKGTAYRHKRLLVKGKLFADQSSIVSPEGAVLFAIDLDYHPDSDQEIFQFKSERHATFSFELPKYLRPFSDVFRIDSEGIHECKFQKTATGVNIQTAFSKVGVWLVTLDPETRKRLSQHHQSLIKYEGSFNFNPAKNPKHLEELKLLLAK